MRETDSYQDPDSRVLMWQICVRSGGVGRAG